ncbi:MAG: molybdopterin-dependent oxidoreductase [Desulfobacterales bacterium]
MDIITACTMDCPDACSLVVSRKPDNTLVIRGNPAHPFTKGIICGKAKKHLLRLTSPHRITCPMIQTNNRWEKISWNKALDICAEKIDHYRKEPEGILHIHGEGSKGALKQIGKFFFGLLGASRLKGSLCDAAGIVAYLKDFGSRENHDPIDLLNSQRIVVWGKDLSRSSLHTAGLVQEARKKGAKVLSISPEQTDNAAFSDEQIRIRPGTDRFLAAAVINGLIEKGLPTDNIIKSSKNWDKFKQLIQNASVEHLLKCCDIEKSQFRWLFDYYGSDMPCATIIGAGLQRYEFGGENVRFINALVMVSGNIGLPGGGSYFHLHSLKNINVNLVDTSFLLPRRTLRMPLIGKEIESANPPVRMIWVNGSNIVNQAPAIHDNIKAFQQVEFKVVVDAFMTDTAKMADLFLPSTLMFEQEDIVGSYLHDFVHYVPVIIEPPDEAKNDFDIFTQVGKRLNPPVDLPDINTCLQSALNSEFLNLSLDGLRKQHFVRANCHPVPYTGLKFKHQDQKYRFPNNLHPEPAPPREYPFRLLSLVRRNAIHSQILPENQKKPPSVWVSPTILKNIGINPEKTVYLVSPIGRMEVYLKEKEGLYPDIVLYRRGDWLSCGGGVNQIIDTTVTDMGTGAAFYSQYVRLENK